MRRGRQLHQPLGLLLDLVHDLVVRKVDSVDAAVAPNAEATDPFAFAEAVSCTGAEHCTAVGEYPGTDGDYRPLAATTG